MDAFLHNFTLQPFTDAWLEQALTGSTQYFVAFALVMIRMSGLVMIGPVFGHPDIPLQIRVLLVVALSLLVTPGLLGVESSETFRRFDQNHDGRLVEEELPPSMHGLFTEQLERAGRNPGDALTTGEFRVGLPLPRSLADLTWLAVAEFGLGLALGLGVLTIAAAMQLGGYLIDQQTGISLGEVFNPELDTSSSLTAETLYWVGTVVFLIVGGHVLVVTSLMDTFQSLPVGYAVVSQSVVELLSNLVHQSLSLAIRVSAPIMVTMSLVGLSMGFLGHTIPQINILVVGFPIRMIVGLTIVGLSLTTIGDIISNQFPTTISELKSSLVGTSTEN